MTHKKTSSRTKQQIHPRLLVVILLILIGLTSHAATYAADGSSDQGATKKPQEKNNALLISTEQPGMAAEKDFDKIRGYESYDPITNTWSAIEDFEEVELLEDATQHRDENYIYYSFWAYDPVAHQWKRVDIREYGYKNAKHPSPSDQATTKKPKKKKFEFWKNLGLTFAAGGGFSYYINTFDNLNLIVRKGQKEHFLQVPGSQDASQGRAYKIRWFSEGFGKLNSLKHDNLVNNKQSYEEVKGDFSFHGMGFYIPITTAIHYTFFKKLRIGVGNSLEVNYVKKMYPHGAAEHIIEYATSKPWFYHWKLFGTIGYKVFQQAKHAVVIDTQVGTVWDFGETWKQIPFGKYVYNGYYGSLGTAHEIKLNDFFKFFYRLSLQLKRYYHTFGFNSTSDNKPSTPAASMTFWQPAIHLEIGTIFNFGRDKDVEDEDEEEDNELEAETSVTHTDAN
jgi:hypothetical protein